MLEQNALHWRWGPQKRSWGEGERRAWRVEFFFWPSQLSNNNQALLSHAERPAAQRTAKHSYACKSGQRGNSPLLKNRKSGRIQAEANIANFFFVVFNLALTEANLIQAQQMVEMKTCWIWMGSCLDFACSQLYFHICFMLLYCLRLNW